MLKRTVFMAAILLAILGLALPSPALAQDSTPPTSSLLVKIVAGLTTGQQADVIARNGGTEVSTIPALRLHVIEVLADQLADTLARYQADPQVVRAEENKTRQAEAAPADPLYSNQWALPMISWDLVFGTVTPTGSAIVAILDTGIDATHPDLAGNVIPGTSILNGTDGLTDPSGHGTWMAGIIAARTNSEGIAGVGYAGVRVMPVTVLNANGLGQDSDVITGVIWAADHGANVILMAFSNPGFSDNLQDAIDYAWSKGTVLVAAVGNDAVSTPTFPAGDRGVIGVSATDNTDSLASFSNDGQAVFLAAPGTGIETTNIGGTYGVLSGTSASAAIVAAGAAMVKAVDPTLANGVIVGRLARTADPAGTRVETGNGRINLARALEDTGTDFVEPAGAAPVGGGGPFVGPYRAATASLSLTPSSGIVGTSVGVTSTGSGFTANATISITFAGSSVSTTPNPCSANSGGNIITACNFTVPSASAGSYTVSGTGGTHTLSATFTITGKIDPTVTFTGAPASAPYQGTFTVASTTNSTASPVYTSSGACSNVGTLYTMTSATGTCTSTVTWAADANYNGATRSQTTTAQKADQATLTVNAGSPLTYNTSETLTTSGGSGTGAVSYSVTAGSCTVLGDQLTATSGTGTCSVTATKAADANYNATTSAAATVTLQQAPQAISFAALTDKHFGDADFGVSATGGASGQPVTFTATGPCTVTGSTVHITGVGSCTITAHQAGDANYSAAPDVPQSFTITDNTPPETSVDSGPTSPTNATTASFTFSGTDDVTAPASPTFECQLDSGGFSACTSPKTYASLADGPHTFEVRAKDAAGNVDPTPASFNWSVDTAPPNTLLDSMPDSLTNQTTATFSFHATEPSSTFECSLDGVAFTACTSSAVYPGLTEGPHTFDVRATDAAGNVDPTPASFAWTVDTQAPDTLIDTHPANPTNSNTATFTFHGDLAGGDTFRCQLGADPAAACNSGTVTYSGLGGGSHTFTVTATDAAGNTDPSAASFTWTIDVTPPDTSITGGPTEGSTTTDTSATFDFTGTDNLTAPADLTFECSLDGVAFGPCTSPTSYSGLSRDAHTFAVRAKDAAGNTDTSPATRSWTITKLTPVLTWANPADITYPTALSGTQLNATADVAGSFVYTPASGTVLNAGNTQNLKVDFTPTDATNYSTASKTVTINVLQASSTVTVTVSDAVYDGNPHGGSANVTGAGGLNQAVPVKYVGRNTTVYPASNTAPTAAGDYIAQARYPGDANHTTSNDSKNFSITKASSTVTVSCTAGAPHTYTGAAQTPCTAQATGVGMSPVNVTASLIYANNTSVGAATAMASWGGDANHTGSTGSGGFAISKANAFCTVTGYSVTYDGSAHTATGACTGVLSESLSGLNLGGTTHTNAGTYSDSWTFTDSTGNYNNASGTVTDIINPAPGSIEYTGLPTWATSSPSSYSTTVTSSATVTVTQGDITTARVTFYFQGSSTPISSACTNVPVGMATATTGSAACQWTATIPNNSNFNTYTIVAVLGGNYGPASDDGIVNVILPSQTNFITGGGFLALTSSAGTYAGAPGSKNNFGFNVKYNKQGTNLQGNVNIIVRQGYTIYQFKSNALNNLTVTVPSATFTSKANLQSWDIRNPTVVTSLGGNLTLQLQMHDVAEPGAGKDTLGITVWDSGGALLFSSNWQSGSPPKTVEQTLGGSPGGGNIAVH